MKVLIVPEDFRNDQYMLKPILSRLFVNLGKGNVKLVVCNDPLLGGVEEVLKSSRIGEIVDRYAAMVDLILICVDRDGVVQRRNRLSKLEAEFDGKVQLLGVDAWEEIETWLLAGLEMPKGWVWADIRSEVSVKQRYFVPFAKSKGEADGPGGGRKALGLAAAKRVDLILQKCPEDFGVLSDRIAKLL